MKRLRHLWFIIIPILAIIIAVFISGSLSAPESNQSKSPYSDNETVSVTGKTVCLPHRDQDGPQTLECALGMLADDGHYYALHDTTEGYSLIGATGTGSRVTVEGVFRSKPSDKYQDVGLIEMTSVDVIE